MPGRALEPIRFPVDFWDRPEVTDALASRDIGRLFQLVRQYGGASQTRIGIAVGMPQGQVSVTMNGGRKIESITVLERIADGLHMPAIARERLGLAGGRMKDTSSAADGRQTRPSRAGARKRHVASTPIPIRTRSKLPVSDTVVSVIELGRADVERRQFLTATAAVGLAALDLTDIEAVTRHVHRRGTVRVGMGEVTAIRAMTTALGDTAAELGGGHARHLALRYLIDDVQPWLDGSYPQRVRRELFAATSQLVHLIGWMARDSGAFDLAKRYHVHSYQLAREAGENELAATALRGLADQAIERGDIATAVKLAEACERQGRALDNSKALAYYRNTYARALAVNGNRVAAIQLLLAAQKAMERAPTQPGESWASHYSHGRWAHESGMIHACMGDLSAAAEHLRLALDIYGLDRRRTRAIVLADLGHVQLKRGDTAEAIATWNSFVDCANGVQSTRVRDAAHSISAQVDKLPSTAPTTELKRRLAAWSI